MAKHDFVLLMEHAMEQLSAQLQLNFQLWSCEMLLRPEISGNLFLLENNGTHFGRFFFFWNCCVSWNTQTKEPEISSRIFTVQVFDKAQKYVSMCFVRRLFRQLWNMGLWWQHRLP